MCKFCMMAQQLSGKPMMCKPCWRKAYKNRKPKKRQS